jgi:hypothetical protein
MRRSPLLRIATAVALAYTCLFTGWLFHWMGSLPPEEVFEPSLRVLAAFGGHVLATFLLAALLFVFARDVWRRDDLRRVVKVAWILSFFAGAPVMALYLFISPTAGRDRAA